MSTVYEVETKDKEGQIQIVTISVKPDEKPEIVTVEQKEESNVVSTVTSSTEIKTSKKVSEITGEIVTVSTGGSVVELVKEYTPVIVEQVPEIAICEPVYVETADSGDVTWNTMVYASEK